MTYSIVALDFESKLIGVGVASGSVAVGSRVPWARAGVGGVATQAYTNPMIGVWVLRFLEEGYNAGEALFRALAMDSSPSMRQVAVVSAKGDVATHTGNNVPRHYAEYRGHGYACVGNMLVSKRVVEEMCKVFNESKGSLAERLLQALEAGHREGGDIRGDHSAAILVVGEHPIYGKDYDRIIDLRVDYSTNPIEELKELYWLWIKSR